MPSTQAEIPGASPPPMPFLTLSEMDVKRLLTEQSGEVRIDILQRVAIGHTKTLYNPRELAIAEQIFRHLLKDSEVRVRETLAHVLKDSTNIPRDIVVSLIRDTETVALPMLEFSTVLNDADLLAILQINKHSGKAVAIAKRQAISQDVSAVLAQSHNAQAVSQLVKNPGATIGDEAYLQVMDQFGTNPDIMAAMARRPNLPITVVEKVITLVSDTLADSLRKQYQVANTIALPGVITAETDKSREIATLKLVDGKISQHDVEKLVDQLHVFGRLTPSIILTSLCRGNLYFFETSLAKLSNIPVKNARLLIHDKSGQGFKALYGRAGLPDKFFAACKLLIETASEMQRSGVTGGPNYTNTLVQQLLAKSTGQNIDNLSYIIALIRQSA